VSRWSAALGRRLYGEPPGPDAPPVEGLLHLRRILVRGLPVSVVLYTAAGLLVGSTVTWAVLAVVSLLQLCAIAWIGRRIGRDRSPTGLE
jgi:hypothetical protein